MANERLRSVGGTLATIASPYTEIGKVYDQRVEELETAFETAEMKRYRSAVISLLAHTVRLPQRNTLKLFEYGAGIGRITREALQQPALDQKKVEVTAVDVSAQSLLEYEKQVKKSKLNTNVSVLHTDVVSALNQISPLKKFDVAYAFGVYQLSPEDMEKTVRGVLEHLEDRGSYLFDVMPAPEGEQSTSYKNSHGNYQNYQYSKRNIDDMVKQLRGKGFEAESRHFSELTDEKGARSQPLEVINQQTGKKELFDPVFVVIKKEAKEKTPNTIISIPKTVPQNINVNIKTSSPEHNKQGWWQKFTQKIKEFILYLRALSGQGIDKQKSYALHVREKLLELSKNAHNTSWPVEKFYYALAKSDNFKAFSRNVDVVKYDGMSEGWLLHYYAALNYALITTPHGINFTNKQNFNSYKASLSDWQNVVRFAVNDREILDEIKKSIDRRMQSSAPGLAAPARLVLNRLFPNRSNLVGYDFGCALHIDLPLIASAYKSHHYQMIKALEIYDKPVSIIKGIGVDINQANEEWVRICTSLLQKNEETSNLVDNELTKLIGHRDKNIELFPFIQGNILDFNPDEMGDFVLTKKMRYQFKSNDKEKIKKSLLRSLKEGGYWISIAEEEHIAEDGRWKEEKNWSSVWVYQKRGSELVRLSEEPVLKISTQTGDIVSFDKNIFGVENITDISMANNMNLNELKSNPKNHRSIFESHPSQKDNRLQNFVEKHREQYQILWLEKAGKYPIDATLYIPKSELAREEKKEIEQWYLDAVENALQTNQAIFQTSLPKMEYLFINTTEEWNDFQINNKDAQKIKGDRLKAGARYPGVLCFTPTGLLTETNFSISNSTNETPREYTKGALNHETAHAAIGYIYGLKIASEILPGWLREGIPMVACRISLKQPFSTDYKQRLVDFLKDYPDSPPPDDALLTPQEVSTTPFTYNYGQEFLVWLLLQSDTSNTPELELKSKLNTFIQNGIVGDGFDVDEAMQKTFDMSYKEAYVQFRNYLMKENS